MRFLSWRSRAVWLVLLVLALGFGARAQTMPATQGEALDGQHVVLAEAVKGHWSIVVAGFSRAAGDGVSQWSKAVQGDSALGSVTLYQAVMLEKAPGLVRGMVKAILRKNTPAAMRARFVVITQDEVAWRSYFGVSTDSEAYVVLIDPAGQVRWHGHGSAANLEPQLKAAVK